jgi:hypothetical protein
MEWPSSWVLSQVMMCWVPLLTYAVALWVGRGGQGLEGEGAEADGGEVEGKRREEQGEGDAGAATARSRAMWALWFGGVGGGALVALPLTLWFGAWRWGMAALALSVLGGTVVWVANGLRLRGQHGARWSAWRSLRDVVLPLHALGCWGGYYAMLLAQKAGVEAQVVGDGVTVVGVGLLVCVPGLALFVDRCRWAGTQRGVDGWIIQRAGHGRRRAWRASARRGRDRAALSG